MYFKTLTVYLLIRSPDIRRIFGEVFHFLLSRGISRMEAFLSVEHRTGLLVVYTGDEIPQPHGDGQSVALHDTLLVVRHGHLVPGLVVFGINFFKRLFH